MLLGENRMNSRFAKIKNIVRNHIFVLMIILNFITLAFFVILTRLDRRMDLFVKLLIAPLLIYALTIIIFERKKINLDNSDLKIFWVFTIIIRMLVLFIPIGLSDDIYRYIWDGHIQHNGINPYLYSPDSVSLDTYHTIWSSKVNNPHINSPYPPFAQMLFYIVVSVTNDINVSIFLIRIIMIGFDLGTIIILKRIMYHFSIPTRRIMIYAWSPLVIFEFAGNGHIDAIAVFFSLLAIYFILDKEKNGYRILSPISLSIAILTKVYPVILLPFLFLKWNLKEKILFLLSSIILVLPYANNRINPLYPEGQQFYKRYFRYNESIFRFYRRTIEVFYDNPDEVASDHYIIFMIIFSGLLYLSHIYRSSKTFDKLEIDISIINSFRYILLVALLFGPDVQPWYIIWMLPLAVLFYDWVIIAFSTVILLTYQIYPEYDRTGIWYEDPIILAIEYGVVYLLLVYYIGLKSYFRNFSSIPNEKIA